MQKHGASDSPSAYIEMIGGPRPNRGLNLSDKNVHKILNSYPDLAITTSHFITAAHFLCLFGVPYCRVKCVKLGNTPFPNRHDMYSWDINEVITTRIPPL